MKFGMFALLILMTQSILAQTVETHSCTLFTNNGNVIEDYALSLSRDEVSDNISSISVTRRMFYTDLTIYDRLTNEFIGNLARRSDGTTVDQFGVKQDDPDFYVLSSNVLVNQSFTAQLKAVGTEGFYTKYVSTEDALLDHNVYISNERHNNYNAKSALLLANVRLLDRPSSYSLKITRKIPNSPHDTSMLTTTIICGKN